MKKNKILAITFFVLTMLVTHLACIIITHDYVHGYYAAKYIGASAPAGLAFLWFIPFGFGTLLFAMLTISFYRKYKSNLIQDDKSLTSKDPSNIPENIDENTQK